MIFAAVGVAAVNHDAGLYAGLFHLLDSRGDGAGIVVRALPAPAQDELSGKLRLFEAVARLLNALAQRAPVVLLLDDLQWIDGASLDLLRYLGHAWKGLRPTRTGVTFSNRPEVEEFTQLARGPMRRRES